jgi:hypothetical protein
MDRLRNTGYSIQQMYRPCSPWITNGITILLSRKGWQEGANSSVHFGHYILINLRFASLHMQAQVEVLYIYLFCDIYGVTSAESYALENKVDWRISPFSYV